MRLIVMAATLALALAIPPAAQAAPPAHSTTATGHFLDYAGIKASGLPDQKLTIWLPPGYESSTRRYRVLYMHDGHNLFDLAKSNFNKVWRADKAMLAVARRTRTEPHIIVGIWAPGVDRYRQYLPRPIYDAASPALRAQMDRLAGGPIVSDSYLHWIANGLKPWVDAHFRTLTGPHDTMIAGSSMGGLMSCYAFMARPDIFGQAACVSSHWPSVDPREAEATNSELQILLANWFRQSLGVPGARRLWMDHGTATLDAFYAPYQAMVDTQVRANGWQEGRDFESRVYDGAEHDEDAWAARLPEIFGWLLRSKAEQTERHRRKDSSSDQSYPASPNHK